MLVRISRPCTVLHCRTAQRGKRIEALMRVILERREGVGERVVLFCMAGLPVQGPNSSSQKDTQMCVLTEHPWLPRKITGSHILM